MTAAISAAARNTVAAALALVLASCAAGVAGPKGNDTGGIIPWSPQNERAARFIADGNCSAYGKYAVITSVHRVYGDYIAYVCRFAPPLHRHGRG